MGVYRYDVMIGEDGDDYLGYGDGCECLFLEEGERRRVNKKRGGTSGRRMLMRLREGG